MASNIPSESNTEIPSDNDTINNTSNKESDKDSIKSTSSKDSKSLNLSFDQILKGIFKN